MNKHDELLTMPQMAVFDIDGTITKTHSKVLSQEILDGFRHLQTKGVITTISTGRPYIRLREVLGENFEQIINDTALLSVEHGAKIVDKWGRVVVQSAFDDADIEKLIEFTSLNLDMVTFLAYNPGDVNRKTQIWVPEPSDAPHILEKRGWYADIYTGSLLDVKDRLYGEPICNVTLKLKDFIQVENLKLEFTGGSIKAIFQDGQLEYLKSKVTKARAIEYMYKHFGIYERHLLVAGNAINDVDMLNMGVGHRILVGPDGKERQTIMGYVTDKDSIQFLETPEELGLYLQKL
ncbi:MAG: Cof-type HAD-IIB family hydrolase [Candidatus Saccharimonadales bacterium]